MSVICTPPIASTDKKIQATIVDSKRRQGHDITIEQPHSDSVGESVPTQRASLVEIEQYYLGTLDAETRERVRLSMIQPDHPWQLGQKVFGEITERITGWVVTDEGEVISSQKDGDQ